MDAPSVATGVLRDAWRFDSVIARAEVAMCEERADHRPLWASPQGARVLPGVEISRLEPVFAQPEEAVIVPFLTED